MKQVQRLRIGEAVELHGFLIMRKPPHAPKDALYCLLSPLSPSDLKKAHIRPYVILRLTEISEISGRIESGGHVKVKGIVDAYPLGNMRILHVLRMEGLDYSTYWEAYKELALSRNEIEGLIRDTLYANRQLEDAVVYSIFGSPFMSWHPAWGEGVTVSAMKESTRMIKSLWRGLKYIVGLLPRELLLRRGRSIELVDDELDVDFRLHLPESPVKYYVPYSPKRLRNPMPRWVERHFKEKTAIFLTPKVERADPTSILANLSEAPFLLSEPVGYERNRELEELVGNLVVSIFVQRSRVEAISNTSVEYYRRKFEEWLYSEHREHGEKFDALRLSGKVFDTGMRMKLGLRLVGAMSRLEGKERKAFVSRVMAINSELVDLWINEVPVSTMMKLLDKYERYVSGDRRANEALRIFSDLQSTCVGGEVTIEEFLNALVGYGFKRKDAEAILRKLIAAGYLYEPFPNRLKLVEI